MNNAQKSANVTLADIEAARPNKYDIIPLHASDRAAFKSCRRQWNWSSPARENLIPRASAGGIRIPLWYGTGIHLALEKAYNPELQEDPVAVFLSWFDLQLYGGEVTEKELSEYADRNPVKFTDTTWRVTGLADLLPFYNEAEFMELRDLGRGMLEFYQDYAKRNDDFRVISVEHNFSVPILDPNGAPLYMEDTREMPEGWEPSKAENIYGPLQLGNTKQVHARGRMDKVIQENDEGQYGILDHKTTSRLDEDYFRHLDLDEQASTYLWSGEREAEMFDLEYDELEFIVFEGILKHYPQPPKLLKSGLPSIDRNHPTTAVLFEKFIQEHNLKIVFDGDPKMQAYYEYLLQRGEETFISRVSTRRNRTARRNTGIRIFYEAIDMLSNPRLYPNPRKDFSCLNCVFRGPCIAVESGYDWLSMIEDGYVTNFDR